MRVLHFHSWCDSIINTSISSFHSRRLKSKATLAILFALLSLPISKAIAIEPSTPNLNACDNVTNGGSIAGDEFGCPNPTWDPSIISSVELPSGGSGALEYVWMYTTGDPTIPISQWSPIPGSNTPSYDPGPISVTTYYRRCSRRAGCFEYVGETNIVVKEAICCDNVTDGGTIQADQQACQSPFDPAELTNATLPTGGSNALEYQWVVSTTGTAYTASNTDWTVIAGANSESYDPVSLNQTTYFIRLSRRHGCLDFEGVSNMVVINVSDDLAASAAPDAVTCFGGNDGSIDLTPTGGVSPYSYLWSGNAGTSQDLQNLTAGTYSVTVTDANGCTTTASSIVQDGVQITLSATATDESCNGAENGTASANSPSGGTAPYNLVWNTTPPQTTSSITNLAPGTYTVTVTDSLGCTATASAVVDAGPSLDVTLSAIDVICFGKNEGTASIFSIANGSGSYTYLWSIGGQTTTSIINLFAGTYTVTVSDTQGCTGTASANIADGPQIFPNISAVDATCNYSADGAASVAVTGGVSPYTYLWNDPAAQTTATASNLVAGTYAVTITDANGCSTTATETVEAPIPADVDISGTNLSCFNGQDGAVAVTISNGNPAIYSYIWDDPAASTTPTVTGLAAGTYGVTVTDNNGCLVTESITITQPTQLVISMDSEDATCGNGSDGSVSATVVGGTPLGNGDYNYQWTVSNSPNVSSLDDVSPGNYSVTVSDANGCTAVGTATIGAPPVLTANLTINNVTCHGLADGQMSVTAAGGILPYTYAWANNGATGTSIDNLAPGNYAIVVTDSVGCTAFASGTVSEPTELTLTTQKFDVVCVTDSDGSAVALPTGGTAPYTYAWSNGQTSASISNLGVGNYFVTVTDANGCTEATLVQIISTTTLAVTTTKIDASCFTSTDGAATAVVAGGTAPFSYIWSNGVTAASNPNLGAGTYGVTVSDADGCLVSSTATVNSPSQLVGTATVASPITIYGGSNGSVTVSPTGGVSPYTVVWGNGSTLNTLTGLSAGAYSVTTTDANGCTTASAVNLTNPSKIGNFVWHDLNQNGIQELGEPGLANVKLHLIGATSTGTQIHFTTFSDTTGNYAFDGLAAGTYQVKVDLPAIHVFSPANIGNDLLDSDINHADSSTIVFNLAIGNYESRWDVGLIELDDKINIGDYVWQDVDHDGIQGQFEQGLANYTVRLYSMPSNTLVQTKTTNTSGKYLFTDVYPGLYQVEFAIANLPNGQFYSPQNQGSNDNVDSDPDPTTGRTATFQVFPFTVDNLTIDAGVFKECDNVTDGGLIGYNEALCGIGADPAEIVNLTLPSGGFGVLEYLWLKSTVAIYNGPGDPNWSPIPNSNSASYNPGPINQTTYYIRCSRRQGCPDYPAESNIVSKTITPNPLAQIIDAPVTICHNTGDRFEAAIAGGGASYYWEFGENATPANASSRVVNPVSWSTPGTKTVTLTVTRFGCSVSVTTQVLVNLCGDPLIVIFDDVTAELDGDVANIRWKVAGAEPTASTFFFVQRSEDGAAFENLNVVSGTAHDANGEFEYVDEQLRLGENIYRIVCRQEGSADPDGISPTASVFYQPVGVMPVQIYPNPTTGKMTVEFVNQSSNSSNIEVWSTYGRLVHALEVPAMTEKVELDLSNLALGVYWVRIQSDNVREQIVKVVKSE